MGKRIVFAGAAAFLVLVAAFGPSSSQVSAVNPSNSEQVGYTIVAGGKELTLDAPARLSGSTMLVPLRNIAEALGAQVTYDHEKQSVTAVKGDAAVTLYLGTANADKNGRAIRLEAAAVKDGSVSMVPVRFFSEALGAVVKWDGENWKVLIDNEGDLLPALSSYGKLKELLNAAQEQEQAGIAVDVAMAGAATMKSAASERAPAASSAAADSTASSKGSGDYSRTNVQTEGVDEADTVKTDGEFIYQVNKQKIIIAKADPAEEMKLVSTVDLKERKLNPLELYIDGDRLTVIGTSEFSNEDRVKIMPMPGASAKMVLPMQAGTVKAVIFDIASKENPKAVKEVELEGSYLTSRKIGSSLYLVTNRYLDRYNILNGQEEQPAPAYRDSAAGEQPIKANYEDIRYFPDTPPTSYLQIAGIDTADPEKKANVSVYLGSGEKVYASDRNLYVTMPHWKPVQVPEAAKSDGSAPSSKKRMPVHFGERSSEVYKFRMDDGQIRFTAKGNIPGSVLNQFSMDERDGYLRIAATNDEIMQNGQWISKNNLYVLNESMAVTGKIEDLAPGERIYSVRFMGSRGYMVTFKKVDPLFVLDLSDPSNPAVLGKLKIPGYSDYLHPYDETHIIGFGKDTVELPNEWNKGTDGAPSTTAFYQGMKIALFDVSDVSNPKELFKETIGDRGTDSELLHNHKAMLFSKEKDVLAFPVTVAKVDPGTPAPAGAPAYGQFTFQGAYVYRLDLTNGFRLRGTITHLTQDDVKKAGMDWYASGRNVERILYIGDTLYTLSQSEIRASSLETLETKNRLLLP